MSENATNLVEVTNDIQFVYITIPKEYLCVYHKILVMLADYGIEMLKDCKASCTDRNSNVIECFNMFNAAVAAYFSTLHDNRILYNCALSNLYATEKNGIFNCTFDNASVSNKRIFDI
jgi:hypothetical protein